ncbi:hypothetical protein [Mycobacterium sp.]|uniref:hypothetical protein n=1 Tax=Mycobacterium sp. TaxID=1785 RepID=UPI003F7EE2B1
MNATMAVPAPPEPHLGTGLLPATRHRILAFVSGLAGLTATKALKRDLVTIADALTFLMRIVARATPHFHAQASLWLHAIPTTAATSTAVGALVAVYAAIIHGRKSAEAQKGWCSTC